MKELGCAGCTEAGVSSIAPRKRPKSPPPSPPKGADENTIE